MNPLTILLEEASFLVVNKPSGLFTQAAIGIDSVETELRKLLIARGNAGKPYVGLPHRLDRGTSGALLIARNERSLKRLNLQFQTRKIEKRYLAICENGPIEDQGTWVDHLRKIQDQPKGEIVDPKSEGAKEAILHYRVLHRFGDRSLIEFDLETGRMHQIRIQSSSRGFPILGDQCYGSQEVFGRVDEEGRQLGLALHARSIEFRHPLNAKPVCIEAPLPPEWEPWMKKASLT